MGTSVDRERGVMGWKIRERGLFLRFPSLRSSKLSLIINSVIPQKSDREPLGKRQFILKKSALYGVK